MTRSEVVLSAGYSELLEDLKSTVVTARWRAQRLVNTELLTLYWRLGHTILHRQQAEGWGARVVDRSRRTCGPLLRCAASPSAT